MEMALQREDRRQWMLAFLIALLTAAILFLPYCFGYWFAQPGTTFTGVIMNAEDSQSYFAKMLQGYNGNWLYTIPYTTESHPPAFVGGFYLLLGQLARLTGSSITFIWHASRLAASLILFLTTFGFIRSFLTRPHEYWTAYLLALYGSGLGWVLFVLGQTDWLGSFPVDFKMPEAHLFFAALTFPHVALGMALLMGNVWCVRQLFDRSPERGRWKLGIAAGCINVALAVVYPFLIYLVLLANLFYFLFQAYRAKEIPWRSGVALGVSYLLPAPLIFYYAWVLDTNEVFRAWDAQSITLSPHPLHYLVAYGPMLVLALLASKRPGSGLLWIWILATAILVYAPLNPQRRFVEGVHVPLSILATCGLFDALLPRLRQTSWFQAAARRPSYSIAGLERILILAFLGFMSLSNLYILASVGTTTSIQQVYPFFRSRDELDAVEWLRANTDPSEVVLSAYETGNYIAAHAGNRVVIGHWAETLEFDQKEQEVDRFFSSPSDGNTQSQILDRYGVEYVFVGDREKQLGQRDSILTGNLQIVYENETVKVYRVVR